jgi:hypothetical protein
MEDRERQKSAQDKQPLAARAASKGLTALEGDESSIAKSVQAEFCDLLEKTNSFVFFFFLWYWVLNSGLTP